MLMGNDTAAYDERLIHTSGESYSCWRWELNANVINMLKLSIEYIDDKDAEDEGWTRTWYKRWR